MENSTLVTLLSSLGSLSAGLFLGRRRRNAETDSIFLKNAADGIEIFRTAYEEKVKMMADTCTQLKIEVRELIEKTITQRQENEIFKSKIIELEIENGVLKGKISILEKQTT